MIKNPYESIIFWKKIPYWLFWLIVGWIILIGGSQVLSMYFGKNHLPTTRLIAGFAAPVLPVIYIWLHKKYKIIMQGLTKILLGSKKGFLEKFSIDEDRIFTFHKLPAKLFTGSILVATITTILVSDLNFISTAHRLYFILWITPVLFLCSHGCYILFALLANLYFVVRIPAKVPFLMLPHPAISELQSYFSKTAIAISLLYILLALAFYETFQLQPVGVIWLSILGMYPSSLFVWSIIQIHELLRGIKQKQYQEIGAEIDKTLKVVLSNNKINDVNRLDKLIDIQKKIQSMPEWSINFQSIFTFTFTFLTAAGQIVVSVLSLSR